MLSTIFYWLHDVPLAEPWRAIVLIALVLTFTFILHNLWELGYTLAGKRGRSKV
jgi:hypothetical protein